MHRIKLPRFFRSLGFKLVLIVTTIIILIILFFAFLMEIQSRQLFDQILEDADKWSDTIKKSSRYAMLHVQRESLHKMIEAIGEQEGIERVRIFNSEGAVIFSSDKNEMGKMVDKKAEACFGCHSAEKPLEKLPGHSRHRVFSSPSGYRVLGLINPIYNEKDCSSADCHAHPETQKILGIIDVDMSLASVDKRIEKNKWLTSFSTGTALFLVMLALSIFFTMFIRNPIKIILVGIQKVMEGDHSHKITINSRDEFGQLAEAWNAMIMRLQASDKAARDFAKSLEHRIVELKETQEILIKSEKLASLGKLSAAVAHEINNPLAILLNYCHIMQRRTPEGDPNRKSLKIMIDEITRCSKIVLNLLEFARGDQITRKIINPNFVIDKALSLIEKQALFHNISIEKKYSTELPDIPMDENQIIQVFINVLINAAEAMPKGGNLTIETAIIDSFVDISFKDNGCGIPRDVMNRIFDPFFSTKEVGKGSGLGLAISYGIVERHRGKIEVESIEGIGSSFHIKLPIFEELTDK